ncbi:hypothetical protein [Nocardia noduli]|uniref:hypothetical protein n=1 Tax=Nocardia noduli TaxID=2815722 RepID=UPI001C23C4F5|nr:hypothetical protein [Nocardia noduli]
MVTKRYDLTPTTQALPYPPSTVFDTDGNFLVVGWIPASAPDGSVRSDWGRAVVGADSPLPEFGEISPYRVVRELPERLSDDDGALVLHTLPVPLPADNYPVVLAPDAAPVPPTRPSYPLHSVPVPHLRAQDGWKITEPITLAAWLAARGRLDVSVSDDQRRGEFRFEFDGLIPNSLYTVMAWRAWDRDPDAPSRPGPLGVPNTFVTDTDGVAAYRAELPNPFPDPALPDSNRVVGVVVLWHSYQRSYGGAVGQLGFGGDVHAQLTVPTPVFDEFRTRP